MVCQREEYVLSNLLLFPQWLIFVWGMGHFDDTAWISYLNIAMLIGTLAIALFNAAKDDIARYMAYAYAVISVGIIVRSLLFTMIQSSELTCTIMLDLRLCCLSTPYHHDPSTRPRTFWCALIVKSPVILTLNVPTDVYMLLFFFAIFPSYPCSPLSRRATLDIQTCAPRPCSCTT